MKQSAVEWLVQQLNEQIKKSAHNELGTIRTGDYRIGLNKAIDFCEQAKELEKQQIIDAYEQGDKYKLNFSGEYWHNQTYGKAT